MSQVTGMIPGMKKEEEVPDVAPQEGEYQEYTVSKIYINQKILFSQFLYIFVTCDAWRFLFFPLDLKYWCFRRMDNNITRRVSSTRESTSRNTNNKPCKQCHLTILAPHWGEWHWSVDWMTSTSFNWLINEWSFPKD